MKEVKITCDNCGEDLKYTAYEYEYRLELLAVPKSHEGSSVYDMGIPPEIKNDMHFCNLKCLLEELTKPKEKEPK